MTVLGPLLGLVLFGGSCAAATWSGSRVRSGVFAFLIAWFLTPVFVALGTLVLFPLIRLATNPNSDGTFIIMFPFLGAALGLISGTIAAVMVGRRNPNNGPK